MVVRPESMSEATIKLMFVDDDERLGAAWERLIAHQPDIDLVAWCRSADAMLERLGQQEADIVLLDLTMQGRDPLDALVEVSDRYPRSKVIVCTGLDRRKWEDVAREVGAADYVDKTDPPAQILETIRRVAKEAKAAR
ncbi:MAG TPA: response regulator transcription factor [Phycisphaerales bacterium]|nr:response regulator transcription factor [Phycisphaerales bacterium]